LFLIICNCLKPREVCKMVQNNCDIRLATIDDSEIIYNIDKECDKDRYTYETIKKTFDNDYSKSYILYNDTKPIAYINISVAFDECDIIKIVVSKDYRRRGFASCLLKHVLSELTKAGIISCFLEVRKSNVPAKMLYEKNGFVKSYERKKYYHDGEDAEIYGLKLNE